MDLHFRKYGDGPPLLILHGLFGGGANWHTLASHVFALHFSVYVVDLRNHGKSPHSDTFTFAAMIEDLVGLVEKLSLSTVHILGHSLGGKAAMHLALNHQDLVDRLVCIDISPRAYSDTHAEIFKALNGIDPALFSSREEIDSVLALSIADAAVRAFLLQNIIRDGQRYRWRMNLAAIERGYPDLLGAVKAWSPFEGDVLFLRGGRSDYIRDGDIDLIHALFPYAHIETVPGAGHWIHVDVPEALAQRVLSFLLS